MAHPGSDATFPPGGREAHCGFPRARRRRDVWWTSDPRCRSQPCYSGQPWRPAPGGRVTDGADTAMIDTVCIHGDLADQCLLKSIKLFRFSPCLSLFAFRSNCKGSKGPRYRLFLPRGCIPHARLRVRSHCFQRGCWPVKHTRAIDHKAFGL
jgi:hypothetical protein